jgi:hypothetical protein
VRVSCVVSQILAKKVKPFTDGELVKERAVAVSELMFPVTRWHIDDTRLSRFIVWRRFVDISGSLERYLLNRIPASKAISLSFVKVQAVAMLNNFL